MGVWQSVCDRNNLDSWSSTHPASHAAAQFAPWTHLSLVFLEPLRLSHDMAALPLTGLHTECEGVAVKIGAHARARIANNRNLQRESRAQNNIEHFLTTSNTATSRTFSAHNIRWSLQRHSFSLLKLASYAPSFW